MSLQLLGPERFLPANKHSCEAVLRQLPQWFGIESSLLQYVEMTTQLPTWTVVEKEEVQGFLCLEQHYNHSAEIHVMALHPRIHRQGWGKRLVEAAEKHCREKGIRFLQVKTLSERSPDLSYAKTREFYKATGFEPLQEFPELWGIHNPCLQLLKCLW